MRYISILLLLTYYVTVSASECIAHRGDNQNFFENSIASFESAVKLDAHGIEFDLRHTKDGVAIVMHDKTLKRTAKSLPGKHCPLKTKIKKLLYKNIQEKCQLKDNTPVPTLEKVLNYLEEYPGHLFIELKDSPSKKSLALILKKRLNKADTTKFISFRPKHLRKSRRYDSFYREIEMLNINVILPFSGSGYGLDVGKWGRRLLSWPKLLKRKIGVWTVDKRSQMKKFMKMKIPYITTNNISTCMKLSQR